MNRYVCVYVCMYSYVRLYVYMFSYVCMHACMHVYGNVTTRMKQSLINRLYTLPQHVCMYGHVWMVMYAWVCR